MFDPERLNKESQMILDFLFKKKDVSVFCKDLNSAFFNGNDSFLRDCGLNSLTTLIGKSDYDLLWTKEESAQYRLVDKEIMARGLPKTVIEEQTDYRCKKRWIETSKIPLFGIDGKTTGLIGYYFEKT